MTVRTAVLTNSGATLAISASIPATYDAAGYAATTIAYTAVGQIETHGAHGVTATMIEFTPVDTAVVAKLKGSKNYGTKALTIGYVPGDAGQVILKTASESNNHYSVKVTYPLGTGESTAEVHYLDVIVSKLEYQNGSVNDAQKCNVELAVSRAPVIVAAT